MVMYTLTSETGRIFLGGRVYALRRNQELKPSFREHNDMDGTGALCITQAVHCEPAGRDYTSTITDSRAYDRRFAVIAAYGDTPEKLEEIILSAAAESGVDGCRPITGAVQEALLRPCCVELAAAYLYGSDVNMAAHRSRPVFYAVISSRQK